MIKFRSTTVLGVIHNGRVALGSDGQATMGDVVVKHNAKKIRSLYDGKADAVVALAQASELTLYVQSANDDEVAAMPIRPSTVMADQHEPLEHVVVVQNV